MVEVEGFEPSSALPNTSFNEFLFLEKDLLDPVSLIHDFADLFLVCRDRTIYCVDVILDRIDPTPDSVHLAFGEICALTVSRFVSMIPLVSSVTGPTLPEE